jgi:hypothetical protein
MQSRACVLPMCIAQSQACNALTDGRPQRAVAPGEDGPERARDKNAGVLRMGTRRVCRTPCTCRRSLALAHASGTCGSRRVRRPRCSSRRPATPPSHPAPDEARGSRSGPWCASPHGEPCSTRLTGARRVSAWPRYPPRCSVASWRDWYGRRVPARPADSPQPARLCARRG